MKFDILKIGVDPIIHFEATARLKGLKLAAGELGLSQPAITHSLNRLEESLGVILCIRTRSQFALTEPGRRLFRVAETLKKNLRDFQGFLAEKEAFDGVFSVGILGNTHNEKLEATLAKAVRKFPDMKLNIQAFTASEIQSQVSVGELDLGVGIFNRKEDGLSYAKIGTERICHFISDLHPLWGKGRILKRDLVGEKLAWSDIVSRNRAALERDIFSGREHRTMKVAAYANNLQAALLILQSGFAVVPLPEEFLQTKSLNFKCRRLDNVFEPYSLDLEVVSRKDFAATSPIAGFFLKEMES